MVTVDDGLFNVSSIYNFTTICHVYRLDNFSIFLPPGWSQEEDGEWRQSNTNIAGGISPEAKLDKNWIKWSWSWLSYVGEAFLESAPIDTTCCSSLRLSFKHHIYGWSSRWGGYTCEIQVRSSSSENWVTLYEWDEYDGEVVEERFFDISGYIGDGTQIRFKFEGWYRIWSGSNFESWYVDDVCLEGFGG